jgi:sulfite reductase (ferredoxin)
VTPYAKAIAFYLLGHRDTQDFGRKFKIAFSGCEHEACALVSMHDLGGIAKRAPARTANAARICALRRRRTGRGAASGESCSMNLFAEEDLLPLARAMGRVFARLGEKRNRNKARVKFLVQKLGIEEFRKIVWEEFKTMPEDPSWREHFR